MYAHTTEAPAPRTLEIDLRDFARRDRPSAVFEYLDDLAREDRLVLTGAVEPEPLHSQLERWCGADFRWTWLRRGPAGWRAEITRRR